MIKIGDFNKLRISRKTGFGYYLDSGTGNFSEDILIPNGSLIGNELSIGDTIEVFVYRDSSDRLIATLKRPLAKVGELAYLRVISNTKIGTFVDFGLEKDILVPFKERTYPLQEDNYYLFYIYLDKTGRIAATTDIDRHLETTSEYNMGDTVSGTVYGFQTNKSAMIAVDNKFKGIILKNEYFTELHCGEILDLTVKKIYDDEKIGLTPRKPSRIEVTALQETLLEYLRSHNGHMSFNDKSSPEEIYEAFHVSKKHFKNALGGLMKRDLILQNQNGTVLK